MPRSLARFAALILVPVLVAGGFLWGTWNATDRLHGVEAAIVNLDEAVTIDGQFIPLGRQLSANLVDTGRAQNFTWVLADQAHAEAGLKSGRYAAAVIIPTGFSAAATSYADDPADATQATIEVKTSPVVGIADASVGKVVADAAAKTLNETLTKAYLDRIYIGFNDMGKQLQTVADGAAQLADGAGQLDDGIGQLATGAQALNDGMGQLADGSPRLASGAEQAANGADKLADGLALMRSKTSTLPANAKKLASGTKAYVGGVNQLINATSASAAQLPKLAGGVGDLTDGVRGLASGLKQYQQGMSGIASNPGAAGVDCPAGFSEEQCHAFFAGLAAGTGIAAQQVGSAVDGAEQLSSGMGELDAQVSAFAKADPDAAKQLAALKSGGNDLASGVSALAAGLPQLADGIGQSATGARQLANGLGDLSSGVDQYTSGVTQAASGAAQLSDGVGQLKVGSGKLADGTDRLADGLAKGVSKLPTYTESDRESLTQVVASPIRTTDLNSLVSPSTALASLLLVLSLWLGALATYAFLPAMRRGLALSTRSSGALLTEALRPGVVITGAQALLLAALGAALLALPLPKTAAVVGMLVLAAGAFVAVNHALAAWLGMWGRLIALALAVIGAASAVTSTVPLFFDAVRAFSPVTPALDGLRGILTDSPGVAANAYALVGWLAVSLVASLAAVMRRRTVSIEQVPALA